MTIDISNTTEDALLDGRVKLRQPKDGFRAAIDTVFLAAAVPAKKGDRVLDLGAGVGGAAMALAFRVPGIDVSGLEKDKALAALCNDNAALNDFGDRVRCVSGSVMALPDTLAPGSFDHVMMNPPYRDAGTGTSSPNKGREAANAHQEGDVTDWVATALRMVRPKGYITAVYDTGGFDDLVVALTKGAGEVTIFPLWASHDSRYGGKPAKRVIVRARKGAKSPARMLTGLVLHAPDGSFAPEADEVLRDAMALDF